MKIHWGISWRELPLLESDSRGVSREERQEINLPKVKVELLAVS